MRWEMKMQLSPDPRMCAAQMIDSSSTNVHYHGTHSSPTCHQEESIHTYINSGEAFTYDLEIPRDETPGLFWYHPHVHGMTEAAVQGGASGAIIIEGIEKFQPLVAGLPARVLILRDQLRPDNPLPGELVPSWDLSLNFIPIQYPSYTRAVIPLKQLKKQLWRVVNAGADTIQNLQLQYDQVPQSVQIVALDGVPISSEKPLIQSEILLPPASRAEFIITGPSENIKSARLVTLKVETGPGGDSDPTRPIASLVADPKAAEPSLKIPQISGAVAQPSEKIRELLSATVTTTRKSFFRR